MLAYLFYTILFNRNLNIFNFKLNNIFIIMKIFGLIFYYLLYIFKKNKFFSLFILLYQTLKINNCQKIFKIIEHKIDKLKNYRNSKINI